MSIPMRSSVERRNSVKPKDPFHGENRGDRRKIMRDQQVRDYKFYQHKVPHKMNPNPGEMFNGYNSQLEVERNPHRQHVFDSKKLQPNQYDMAYENTPTTHVPQKFSAPSAGKINSGDSLSGAAWIPQQSETRGSNMDKKTDMSQHLFGYRINQQTAGNPKMISPITDGSRNFYKQRRSDRTVDDMDHNNRKVWEHVFTPNMTPL